MVFTVCCASSIASVGRAGPTFSDEPHRHEGANRANKQDHARDDEERKPERDDLAETRRRGCEQKADRIEHQHPRDDAEGGGDADRGRLALQLELSELEVQLRDRCKSRLHLLCSRNDPEHDGSLLT